MSWLNDIASTTSILSFIKDLLPNSTLLKEAKRKAITELNYNSNARIGTKNIPFQLKAIQELSSLIATETNLKCEIEEYVKSACISNSATYETTRTHKIREWSKTLISKIENI
jgi:hypothetical protein